MSALIDAVLRQDGAPHVCLGRWPRKEMGTYFTVIAWGCNETKHPVGLRLSLPIIRAVDPAFESFESPLAVCRGSTNCKWLHGD